MPDRELRLLPGDEVVVIGATGQKLSSAMNAAKTRVRIKSTNTPPPPPPDPDPDPPPPPPPPPAGAFMSYPLSSAISLTGQNDVVIEGKSFRNTPAGRMSIVLTNCKRITIRNCDFENIPGCVYAVGCEDIVLEDLRYSNITGPHTRTGGNYANFVQFNGVTRGAVRRCKGKGGDTEDIVSVYKTTGMVVEDCHFEGTNWSSPSGSGIALGDDGGTNNIARRNIVVNPGQVGIFIAGGTNCRIENNTIIGQQRPKSNVGMYVWNQYASACSGHTVNGNKVSWRNEAGASNPYWNAGNCGPVSGSNDLNANLNIEDYRVVL